jgi:hypothetical protein
MLSKFSFAILLNKIKPSCRQKKCRRIMWQILEGLLFVGITEQQRYWYFSPQRAYEAIPLQSSKAAGHH